MLSESASRILACLADGQWHSGEELGAMLGVSRAAVAKQVKNISDLGLALETLKGVGYRMPLLELLDRQRILDLMSRRARLDCADAPKALDVIPVLDSTNQYLLDKKIRGEDIHRHVCLAECQTQGRGRRGRTWVSPFAKNVYLSVAWHFPGGVADIAGLSLAVGVLVCRSLEALGFDGALLKWPNDIFVDSKKIGGVLIELSGDAVSDCTAIVGIGLNADMMPPEHAGADSESADCGDIDQLWTSLRAQGFVQGRNALVACLLAELLPALDSYAKNKFAAYVSEWNARSAFLGKAVEVIENTASHTGLMAEVGINGELQIDIEGVLTQFHNGEVRLKVLR